MKYHRNFQERMRLQPLSLSVETIQETSETFVLILMGEFPSLSAMTDL